MTRITNLDDFFEHAEIWQAEMKALRKVCQSTELEEAFKWKQPCYTFEGKNVCIIGAFKDYCVLSFFKGALLKDSAGILEKPGPNTRSGRIVKITSLSQVNKLKRTLSSYISEAIQLEKDGKEVDFGKNRKVDMPEVLVKKLNEDSAFKKAFEALTPGRKRGYLIYFSGSKNDTTILNRIEKYREKIMQGKGMHDWK